MSLRAGRRNYGSDARVDLSDPLSIRHFTRALGCTERELRDAVSELGPTRAALRARFRPVAMTRGRARRPRGAGVNGEMELRTNVS